MGEFSIWHWASVFIIFGNFAMIVHVAVSSRTQGWKKAFFVVLALLVPFIPYLAWLVMRDSKAVTDANTKALEARAQQAEAEAREVASLSAVAVVSNFSKTVAPESHSRMSLQMIVDEEPIYAEISEELETGVVDKGLWTRVFAECGGDDKQTKVLYIQERVKRLVAAGRLRVEQAAVESASTSAKVQVSKLISAYVSGKILIAEDVARLASASSIDPSISTLRDKIRGKTLLHWCSQLGLENEAAILISNGADPNAPDGNGRRAF